MKIIILVEQFFTERDYHRYGISVFKNNGFDVAVWDLSEIIYSQTVELLKGTFNLCDSEAIVRFTTLKSVISLIHTESQHTFFMSTITYSHKTMRIFKAISQTGKKYGCTGTYTHGTFPVFYDKKTLKYAYQKVFDKNLAKKFTAKISSISLLLLFKYLQIKPAGYFALAGGGNASAVGPIISNETFIHYIHAADYDLYLNQNHSKRSKDHIVFIDQYLPYHPDFLLFPEANRIAADQYYADLRKYFSYVESLTGYKVIIAAHPKANYEGKKHLFDGREISCNFNSSELISNASLVLLHFSTAINLAVLFRKPMVFITSDMLNKSSGLYINKLAKSVGLLPVNINDEFKDKDVDLNSLDEVKYKNYISNYVKKPGTKEILFWQQVSDYVTDNID
jgi:hypothetical protein